MICGLTYYQICWYFLLYSFLGWCVEVIFHAVALGKVINRGFLNGPLCPVYGFGMLSVLAAVNSVEQSGIMQVRNGSDSPLALLFLFLGGIILATAVELIAGWLLDVAFHTRWWDYSDKPFNFHGYICLEFSILWGLGITLIIRILHPMIESSSSKFESLIPMRYGWIILAVLYIMALVDMILTTLTVIGLNKKLKELDEMSAKMRTLSDAMTEVIATGSLKTTQVVQEGQVQAALAKAELKDAVQIRTTQMRITTAEQKAALTGSVSQYKEVLTSSVESSITGGKKAVNKAVSTAEQKMIDGKQEMKEKMDAMERQFNELKASVFTGSHAAKRLLRAFPDVKSRYYDAQMQELKNMLKPDIMLKYRKKDRSADSETTENSGTTGKPEEYK